MKKIIITHWDFRNSPQEEIKLRGNNVGEQILNFIYDCPEGTGFVVEDTANEIYKLWESVYEMQITYKYAVVKIEYSLQKFIEKLNSNKKGYCYKIE